MGYDEYSLDQIGLQYGTDKSSNHHNYLQFYERFFSPLRLQPIRLLEIGVLTGASLRMWQDYFPNGQVIGTDIDRSTLKYAGGRIDIFVADQSNLEDLVNLGVKYGPFDIIVEDGSHLWNHQITTLQTLFPFVRRGGFYVVEDLQTNFGGLAQSYRGNASISCTEYLKKLVDLRVGDEEVDISKEENSFLRTYGRTVGFIAFCRHACLIEKGDQDANSPISKFAKPLISDSAPIVRSQMGMNWHVGGIGDIENREEVLINIDESRGAYIQGLQFIVDSNAAECILCRVRGPTGDWTAWTKGNEFLGTRGRSESLTGFSVRLQGDLASRFDILVAGCFAGLSDPVLAANGEDCVPPEGTNPLRAMQIALKPKL